MWPGGKRAAAQAQEDAVGMAAGRGLSGGLVATVISAAALLFSSYSFYESVMRAPELKVFVPPQIQYTDPDRPESPLEVFIIPVTLANDGARTGTVLSIDMEVTNPRTNETKQFYAAQLGSWGAILSRPFAPVSLSGKASFSQALQFRPRAGETVPRILDLEAGDYKFKITLNTATTGGDTFFIGAPKVPPLEFEMQSAKLNYLWFTKTGTVTMWAADYKPAASK